MLNRYFIFLVAIFSFFGTSQDSQVPRAIIINETHISRENKNERLHENTKPDLNKILMDAKVLQAFAHSMTEAHSFITEGGDYPHKSYSLKSNESRFAMRGMTFQIAKRLKTQPQLNPYFTLTKKVENIFHELRFENYTIKDQDKIKGSLFRVYFRLRNPGSERSSVYMMEWDPKDSSSDALKIFSIQGATDAWEIHECSTRTRMGLERNELKASSKALEHLRNYLSKQEEEKKKHTP